MTTPFLAREMQSEEDVQFSANPGVSTTAETALLASLARACDLLDARLARAPAPEADGA